MCPPRPKTPEPSQPVTPLTEAAPAEVDVGATAGEEREATKRRRLGIRRLQVGLGGARSGARSGVGTPRV